MPAVARALVLVLTWYCMSTALSLYNKKVIGHKYGVLKGQPFPAPMLMSSVQFALQHGLARAAHALGARRTIRAVLHIYVCMQLALRRRAVRRVHQRAKCVLLPMPLVWRQVAAAVCADRDAHPLLRFLRMSCSLAQRTLHFAALHDYAVPCAVEPITWPAWRRTILPNGVATGLDIAFSNTSFAFITLSFYTMCKSSAPLFLLFFAFIWGIETPTWSLGLTVAIISTGLLLLVAGEVEFDAVGFFLVMSAACMSGLRWTITQVLLQVRGPLELARAHLTLLALVRVATTVRCCARARPGRRCFSACSAVTARVCLLC